MTKSLFSPPWPALLSALTAVGESVSPEALRSKLLSDGELLRRTCLTLFCGDKVNAVVSITSQYGNAGVFDLCFALCNRPMDQNERRQSFSERKLGLVVTTQAACALPDTCSKEYSAPRARPIVTQRLSIIGGGPLRACSLIRGEALRCALHARHRCALRSRTNRFGQARK